MQALTYGLPGALVEEMHSRKAQGTQAGIGRQELSKLMQNADLNDILREVENLQIGRAESLE